MFSIATRRLRCRRALLFSLFLLSIPIFFQGCTRTGQDSITIDTMRPAAETILSAGGKYTLELKVSYTLSSFPSGRVSLAIEKNAVQAETDGSSGDASFVAHEFRNVKRGAGEVVFRREFVAPEDADGLHVSVALEPAGTSTALARARTFFAVAADDEANMPDGTYFKYYPDGTPQLEYTLRQGRRDGPMKTFHPDGTVSGEGTYRDGRLEGLYKTYFPHGGLKARGHYRAGLYDGDFFVFYDVGQTHKHYQYVQGQSDGPFTIFYRNGQPEITGTMRHGKLDGTYRAYFPEGGPKLQAHYFENMLHGGYRGFRRDGSVQVDWNFKLGKKHGVLRNYHPNRQIAVEANYVNGRAHGLSQYFDAQGRLTHAVELFYDKILVRKRFDGEGRLLEEERYDLPDGAGQAADPLP